LAIDSVTTHWQLACLPSWPQYLMVHADRVLALLGERRVVDDPRRDRPVPFDRRQHHLAHLGQHKLV
jgi:hypothetical protein